MSLAMFFVVRCYREEEEEDTSIVLPLPAVFNWNKKTASTNVYCILIEYTVL